MLEQPVVFHLDCAVDSGGRSLFFAGILLGEFAEQYFGLGGQRVGASHVACVQRLPGLLEKLADLGGCLSFLRAQRTVKSVESAFGDRDRVLCLAPQIGRIARGELADGAYAGAFVSGLLGFAGRWRGSVGRWYGIARRLLV